MSARAVRVHDAKDRGVIEIEYPPVDARARPVRAARLADCQ